MNTSEPRINEDVKRILEEGKLEYAVSEVAKTQRYQLIKIADAEKYLTAAEFISMFDALEPFLKKIEEGRVNEGKAPGNDYIVINKDEEYINDVISILELNNHWDGEPATTPNIVDYSGTVRSKMLEIILKLQKAEYEVSPIDDPVHRPIGVLISEALHELYKIHDYFEPKEYL